MDLWPKDLVDNLERSPVQLLKEQGTKLGEITKGYVEAKVITYKRRDDTDLIHQAFAFFAPALGNYRVILFHLYSSPDLLYPVEIKGNFFDNIGSDREFSWNSKSENELSNVLKEVFSNRKTVSIIRTLLARSEGLDLPKSEDVPF